MKYYVDIIHIELQWNCIMKMSYIWNLIFQYLNKNPIWSKMSYIINLVKLINYIFTYNAWKIRFHWLF